MTKKTKLKNDIERKKNTEPIKDFQMQMTEVEVTLTSIVERKLSPLAEEVALVNIKKDTGFTIPGLKKQLAVIRQNKEEERIKKIVEERAAQKNQYQSKEQNMDVIEQLKDPKMLINIHDEISRRHLWDTKQKMTAFIAACTSFLPGDKNRVSIALLGDSSTGKDNLQKTILDLMPGNALFLTHATQAALEDDSDQYSIIGFSEQNTQKGEDGANSFLVEAIKQMAEGGMVSFKKDTETGFKETKLKKQEQKCVFYGTTESERDYETQTRFLCVPIPALQAKIEAVNSSTLDSWGSVDLTGVDRLLTPQCLDELRKEPLDVLIPFAPLLKESIDNNNARGQRDLKRVMRLTAAMTWLHQKQRNIIQIGGVNNLPVKKMVICEPCDFVNVMHFCEGFLNQSYTGIEERVQYILEKAVENFGRGNPFLRSALQKAVGIKNLNTFKSRLRILQQHGEIEFVNIENNKAVYYQLPTEAPKNNSFFTKQPIKTPVNNLSEGVKVDVLPSPIPYEKWQEMKKEILSKYKLLQQGNEKPLIVAVLNDKDAKTHNTFLVSFDTSYFDTSPKEEGEKQQKLPQKTQESTKKEEKKESIDSKLNSLILDKLSCDPTQTDYKIAVDVLNTFPEREQCNYDLRDLVKVVESLRGGVANG